VNTPGRVFGHPQAACQLDQCPDTSAQTDKAPTYVNLPDHARERGSYALEVRTSESEFPRTAVHSPGGVGCFVALRTSPPTAALAVVAVPYRLIMADGDRLPQNGRVVLVVLRDGRQLEGELHTMSRRYEVGDVAFDPWEIETIEDVT
jgi:hypothetical protein